MAYFDRMGYNPRKCFLAVNTIVPDASHQSRTATASLVGPLSGSNGSAAPFALLYIGVLEPEKRVDHALHALGRLQMEGTDVRLVVVGEGSTARPSKLLRWA